MRTKTFYKLLAKDVEMIKSVSTFDELNRLDFNTFNPLYNESCVLGQLYGDATSDRAKAIAPKNLECNVPVFSIEQVQLYSLKKTIPMLHNFKSNNLLYRFIKFLFYVHIERYSALEYYTFDVKSNIKGLMDYLKGLDTLEAQSFHFELINGQGSLVGMFESEKGFGRIG